jgi:hypothetical protein
MYNTSLEVYCVKLVIRKTGLIIIYYIRFIKIDLRLQCREGHIKYGKQDQQGGVQ